MKINLMVAKKF